jgi:hypothetical protein
LLETVPAVAVNVAVALPAATLTEAGTVTAVLLSESATLTPPLGAAALRVTVQVLAPPDATLVGLQASEETIIVMANGGLSTTVVDWAVPL